jgi:hypothetical protein
MLFMAPLFALSVPVALSEPEEILSPHVQVLHPHGDFAQALIKQTPASGEGWRDVEDRVHNFRITVPSRAQVETKASESRVLQVVLTDAPARPRPVLRIDAFTPGADDPTEVDPEYTARYVEQYPDEAFKGKFTVTDSGTVILKKQSLAMVGGLHPQAGDQAFRLQCAYLSRDQQLFLTFDCAEKDWPQYAETVARILLSFEPARRKKS